MKKEDIKYVKPENDANMVIDLQYIVMRDTNSPLISIEIHRLCQKFVRDLKKIPLSDELQQTQEESFKKTGGRSLTTNN